MDRLFTKIDCDVETRCWNFVRGAFDSGGYGTFSVTRTRLEKAHRVAYRLLVGPIPDGIHLHHKCENRRCCNPEHLQPVTPGEHNHISPRNLVSVAKRKTHCPDGHPLVAGNLVPSRLRNGARVCLTCQRAAIRANYHRNKEQWKARQEERRLRDPEAWNAAQRRYQAAYRRRVKQAT